MRILFVDKNTDHARVLYSQTLEYDATAWDLVHSDSIEEAESWLERQAFDLLLVAIYQNDVEADVYATFVAAHKSMPVVVLSDSNEDEVHAGFVENGAQDSLLTQTANGHFVMRRSRFAIHRHRRPTRGRPVRAAQLTAVRAAVGRDTEFGSTSEDVSTRGEGWRLPVVDHLTLVIDDTPDQSLFSLGDSTVSRYQTCESLDAAVGLLADPAWSFDAVITHQTVLERGGPQMLRRLTEAAGETPLIAVMSEGHDSLAISLIDSGIDDCLRTEPTNQFAIERSLRLANARVLRREAEREKQDHTDLAASQAITFGRAEARRTARYLCDQPMLAIPVLPTGAPDVALMRDARSLDISVGGLALQLPSHQTVPSRNWVVGITGQHGPDDFQLHFASVVVRNVSYPAEGLRLGTAFHNPDDDLLRRENLEPGLDPETNRYSTGLSESVLDQWCEVGVMRRMLTQRVLSCPECSSVLSLGAGCSDCGSAHFETQSAQSARSAGVPDAGSCLQAGSNFDQSYHCQSCGKAGHRLAQVCQCLRCRLRLPVQMAVEELVYGYEVNRLDVMAAVGAGRS